MGGSDTSNNGHDRNVPVVNWDHDDTDCLHQIRKIFEGHTKSAKLLRLHHLPQVKADRHLDYE